MTYETLIFLARFRVIPPTYLEQFNIEVINIEIHSGLLARRPTVKPV